MNNLTFQEKMDSMKQLLVSFFGEGPSDQLLGGIVPSSAQIQDEQIDIGNDLNVESNGAGATYNDVIVIGPDSEASMADCNSSPKVIEIDRERIIEMNFPFQRKDFDEIIDLDLVLLQEKYEKFQVLENKDRNKLSRCIIKHLLVRDTNRQIDRKEFLDISKVIKEVFPSSAKLLKKYRSEISLREFVKTTKFAQVNAATFKTGYVIQIGIEIDETPKFALIIEVILNDKDILLGFQKLVTIIFDNFFHAYVV